MDSKTGKERPMQSAWGSQPQLFVRVRMNGARPHLLAYVQLSSNTNAKGCDAGKPSLSKPLAPTVGPSDLNTHKESAG